MWAASCLDDVSQFIFCEAFEHSLAGSGLSQDDQNCLCISCQLTESKDDDHGHGEGPDLHAITMIGLNKSQGEIDYVDGS